MEDWGAWLPLLCGGEEEGWRRRGRSPPFSPPRPPLPLPRPLTRRPTLLLPPRPLALALALPEKRLLGRRAANFARPDGGGRCHLSLLAENDRERPLLDGVLSFIALGADSVLASMSASSLFSSSSPSSLTVSNDEVDLLVIGVRSRFLCTSDQAPFL